MHTINVNTDAQTLFDIWAGKGVEMCRDQIEAHLESDGYSDVAIDAAITSLIEDNPDYWY